MAGGSIASICDVKESVHFAGATVDTKNALRTFLTSSSDFSSSSASRHHESGSAAATARSNSPRVSDIAVTSSTHSSVPPCTSLMRAAPNVAITSVHSAAKTDSLAGRFLSTGHRETATSLQKSPRQSAPYLPAAAVFPTITDIARFSINSTGHPPLAVPLLVAGVPPVDPGIRSRQLFSALAVTSVPQPPPSLGFLPTGFVAGSALRLPVAPLPPAISVTAATPLIHGGTAERTQELTATRNPSGPQAEQPDHHDVSSAVNWKLKMARDHVSNCEFLLIVSRFTQFCCYFIRE